MHTCTVNTDYCNRTGASPQEKPISSIVTHVSSSQLTSGVGSEVSSSLPTPDLVTNMVTTQVVLLCGGPVRRGVCVLFLVAVGDDTQKLAI